MLLSLLLTASSVLAILPSSDFYVSVPQDVIRDPAAFQPLSLDTQQTRLLMRGSQKTYVNTLADTRIRQTVIEFPSQDLASNFSFEGQTVTIFDRVADEGPFTIANTQLTDKNDGYVCSPMTPLADIPDAYHSAIYLDETVELKRLLLASSYYDTNKVVIQDLSTATPQTISDPGSSLIVDVKDARIVAVSDKWVVVEPKDPCVYSKSGQDSGTVPPIGAETQEKDSSLLSSSPRLKTLWTFERNDPSMTPKVLPITPNVEPISEIAFADSDTLLVKAGSNVNIVDVQTFAQKLIKLDGIAGQAQIGWDNLQSELLVLHKPHCTYKLRRYDAGGKVISEVEVADADEGCPEWESFNLASNATQITRLQALSGDYEAIKLTAYQLKLLP